MACCVLGCTLKWAVILLAVCNDLHAHHQSFLSRYFGVPLTYPLVAWASSSDSVIRCDGLVTVFNFGDSIQATIDSEAELHGETPPTDLDSLLALAGLTGPLDLTPLPDNTPCCISSSSTPSTPGGSGGPPYVHPPPTKELLDEASRRLAPGAASHVKSGRLNKSPQRSPGKLSYIEKKKLRRGSRRAKNRAHRRDDQPPAPTSAFDYKVRCGLGRKLKVTRVLPSAIDANDLPTCQGAWIGKRGPEGKKCMSLAEAKAMGLRLVEWDGM